jgi:hypothetical protein
VGGPLVNTRRFVTASIAAFVVISVVAFVIHGVLLSGVYQRAAAAFRTEADARRLFWLFYVGYLVFAVFFTFIYTKGYERDRGGLPQGLRFGFYVGVMIGALESLVWYVVLPIPAALAFYWFVAYVAMSLAAGATVGWLYRHDR